MEFDQKALEDRIVDQCAAELLEHFSDNAVSTILQQAQRMFADIVAEKCETVIRPMLEQRMNEFVVQQTNRFGEQKGEPVTFAEYVTSRAEAWLTEKVDHDGKPAGSCGRNDRTRLCYLLEKHLAYEIQTAMKDAVKVVIGQIAPAIATTCELKVKEATDSIRRAMGK